MRQYFYYILLSLIFFLNGCGGGNPKENNQTAVSGMLEDSITPIKNPVDIPLSIELVGDQNITLVKGDPYEELGVKAIDKNGDDISDKVETNGEVDTNTIGHYIITYTISQHNTTNTIKRTITIIDNNKTNETEPLKPTIKLIGNDNITLVIRSNYYEAGARATDGKGDDISKNIQISGDIDTTKKGRYIRTYTIKHNEKTDTVSREINVIYPWEYGELRVSDDNRSLQHTNGKGFFWMADTAWDLYKKSEQNITYYMNDRAEKKFTVLQVVAMHRATQRIDINGSSIEAFEDGNLSKPNEAYWKHIDLLLDEAKNRGLYIALLPVWNDAIKVRSFQSPSDARKYGEWIAKRYKNRENIIWVIGGDTKVEDGGRVPNDINLTNSIAKWLYPDENNITLDRNLTKEEKILYETKIWDALGKAINTEDSKHLITFHPMQSIPSKIFNRPKWLDFNMLQSARGSIEYSITHIQEALKEGLAVVDGESLYENLVYGENPNIQKQDMKRTPFQMREDAYSQLFVGAFGNTYGHTAIYRFWEKEKDTSLWEEGADRCNRPGICTPVMHWREALNADGAKQMQYVVELMQSRPIIGRVPDQTLLENEPKATEGIIATKGEGYAMIYSAHGESFTVVNMNKISNTKIKAWWYNPRNGSSEAIDEFDIDDIEKFTFDPPGEPTDPTEDIRNGNDRILVLDDVKKGFYPPGE